MVQIHSHIQHNSGIPLGGIGAGTVEVRPDGLFHEWQIFNSGAWSPNSPCCNKDQIMVPPDHFVFLARVKLPDGTIRVRYLALREQLHDFYCSVWMKCVQSIDFDGQFPIAHLTYEDEELPIEIEAEVFSAFIANDSRNSGTPGFYVHFTVRNPLDIPVEVSIMGCLVNPTGVGQEGRVPHNRLEQVGNTTRVHFTADGLAPDGCSTGDMAFSLTADNISYVGGAFRNNRGIQFIDSVYNGKNYGYFNRFQQLGHLPNLAPDSRPTLGEDFDAAKLTPEQRLETLDYLLQHVFFHEKFRRISWIIPELKENQDKLIEFLNDALTNINSFRDNQWGEAALCSQSELAPGARKDMLFTVSWFFPNHIGPQGNRFGHMFTKDNIHKLGHMYENWFSGAVEVNDYLVHNFWALREQTLLIPELIYNSSLEDYVADALSAQLTTLIKCTWWSKEGNFGVWEGLGCCGHHTTDITYYASYPIIALFPDLQQEQMRNGARMQREDGRVHHFFWPDLSGCDGAFERVDMNQQFVMLATRDYLWSGDRQQLETLWPHILRAMDNTALLDGDGDGLPDHDTKRNTYDVWDMTGCPSFIGSLWLGALKAAARLAKEMGDQERAAQWLDIYERGIVNFEKKLWNGQYYILWRDEVNDTVDECCMSDQISGDWFLSIMGWEPMCKPDRIRKALDVIYRYNFTPDAGLMNASYPPGKSPRVYTAGNTQADANWTGIEYTLASMFIKHGMVGEGLSVVQDVHNRYYQAGRFWNHVECGDHYYRALSSWTVLLALSGFRVDIPAGEMAFAPVVASDVTTYPFFIPNAMGTYTQSAGLAGHSAMLQLADGAFTLKTITLPTMTFTEKPAVTVNGKPVGCEWKKRSMSFVFNKAVTLEAGDVLCVG